jgi:hypothetical protein
MFHQLLAKIINTGIGRAKFWTAVVGLGIAFLLILAAAQLHFTFRSLLKGANKGNDEYLVMSKHINNDMMGDLSKSTFTPAEIEDVKKQPFFDSTGIMVSSRFKVKLEGLSNSFPLSTDMFFEAVPDEFLDIKPDGWGWQPGQTTVPGIMPRMLLDLYNFGFAIGQRMPQMSEESAKTIPFKFIIISDTTRMEVRGRVAGFSDRINSILIPMSFMKWANDNYGFKKEMQPGRLIVHTKEPYSGRLQQYLKDKGYDTNMGVSRFSSATGILNSVVRTVSVIGIIMFIFAVVIFTLVIQLTVASARKEIELLVTLGASPTQLGRFVLGRLMPAYVASAFVALVMLGVILFIIAKSAFLKNQNIFISPWLAPGTVIIAALLLGLIWLINRNAVKSYIKQQV